MGSILAVDGDGKPPFLDRELDLERAGITVGIGTFRLEIIAFYQIEDRDPPLLLDIGRSPQDGAFVETDIDDPGIGHGVAVKGKLNHDNRQISPLSTGALDATCLSPGASSGMRR